MPSTSAPAQATPIGSTSEPIQPGKRKPTHAPAATPPSVDADRPPRAPAPQNSSPAAAQPSAPTSHIRPASLGNHESSSWSMGAVRSNGRYRQPVLNRLRESRGAGG